MSTPLRLAGLAGCAALLLAGPAAAQSNLGGQQSLPPPQPAAPSSAAPARPQASRPQASRPAAPAAPTTRAAQRPPKPTAPATASRPAAGGTTATTRPGSAARPSTSASQPRRRAAGAAAAGAAGGAAGAAIARPAEPPRPAPPPEPRVGSATNLPLPRYASLGSNQVNLRVGPDLRYPIEWTYQRKDLPVQIIDEHQLWRRIRDPEGTEGWVQRPLLTSRRSFLVAGTTERLLRRRPEEGAAEVARLRPGVVGRIRHCESGNAWCEVQVGDYRGYIRRAEIWGVAPDEAVN